APTTTTATGPTVEPISTLIATLDESASQSRSTSLPAQKPSKLASPEINVVLPASASAGKSRAMQVASIDANDDDPIGQLIAESQLGNSNQTGKTLVNIAA